MKRACRHLAIVALLGLIAHGTALAQNDPDEEIYQQFADPRDRAAKEAMLLDMATDANGVLVIAFVEDSWYLPRLVVASQDPNNGGWTELASITPPYLRGKIKDLSLAVGSDLDGISGNNLAFVAAQYEVSPGRMDYISLFNGPVRQPWSRAQRRGILFAASRRPVSIAHPEAMSPSVSVIPRDRGRFLEYAVGIAWTRQTGDPEQPTGVMLTLFETEPKYGGWVYSTWEVAGPTAPTLQGSNFGRPSLTTDLNNGRWAVAVEDTAIRQIHVLSGMLDKPLARPRDELIVFASPTGLHHPSLVAGDAETTLTALGAASGNGFALEWFFGVVWQPGTFIGLRTLHPECRTTADIAVVRGDGYLAADCAVGEGWAVHAFEGERDDPSVTVPGVPVNDFPSAGRPRVALLPGSRGIYGYGTGNQAAYGNGPPWKAMFIDY